MLCSGCGRPKVLPSAVPDCKVTVVCLQVFCLKAVREMEKGGSSKYSDYRPEDEETDQLMKRDPYAQREAYKAAVEDTMILTMKGISAGMQNTG